LNLFYDAIKTAKSQMERNWHQERDEVKDAEIGYYSLANV